MLLWWSRPVTCSPRQARVSILLYADILVALFGYNRISD